MLKIIFQPAKILIRLGLLLALMLPMFVVVLPAKAIPNTPPPETISQAFLDKFYRADKPVLLGKADPPRGYLWGPKDLNTRMEPYEESPGGARWVQYRDKARLEVNNPDIRNDSGAINVTNGLLTEALISGRQATGDTSFIQRQPAWDIPVAGDFSSDNPAPPYSAFRKYASLNLNNRSPNLTGKPVTSTLSNNGDEGNAPELGIFTSNLYYEPTLGHNIPDVFWNFMNQRGTIFENDNYIPDRPVLGTNPNAPWLDATGFPITEAVWFQARVSGVVKPVMFQAFERRTLTFTPTNDNPFKVEMGNIGLTYLTWTDKKYDLNESTYPCSNSPPTFSSVLAIFPGCIPQGGTVFVGLKAKPNEVVTAFTTDPNGQKKNLQNLKADNQGWVLNSYSISPAAVVGKWLFSFDPASANDYVKGNFYIGTPAGKPTVDASRAGNFFGDKLIMVSLNGFKPEEEIYIYTNPIEAFLGGGKKVKADKNGSWIGPVAVDPSVTTISVEGVSSGFFRGTY